MRVVVAGAVVIAIVAAIAAVLIVAMTHGGFNANNLQALGILVAIVGATTVPSVVSVIISQRTSNALHNGLIVGKVQEAMRSSETQAILANPGNAVGNENNEGKTKNAAT